MWGCPVIFLFLKSNNNRCCLVIIERSFYGICHVINHGIMYFININQAIGIYESHFRFKPCLSIPTVTATITIYIIAPDTADNAIMSLVSFFA